MKEQCIYVPVPLTWIDSEHGKFDHPTDEYVAANRYETPDAARAAAKELRDSTGKDYAIVTLSVAST